MDAHRRTTSLRRVAMMAALAALTLPAAQADAATRAKAPVITSVSPMNLAVGDTLTIRGKNFRKGKGRNSVGFKRDGAAVAFVKTDISTRRMIRVKLPTRLETLLASSAGSKVATRFHLRVLTSRFGKAFTPNRLSPLVSARPAAPASSGSGAPIGLTPASTTSTSSTAPTSSTPAPAPAPPAADGDCDGDGRLNGVDPDDDNDFLTDAFENGIGTNGCKADSDGDGVLDGYEFRSAVDLDDDEYQHPDQVLPYPGDRPYPNPLDASDVNTDFDGDGLTLGEEFALWKLTTPDPAGDPFAPVAGRATPLSYSDGMQYSESVYCTAGSPSPLCGADDDNRRVPSLAASGYAKWDKFLADASAAGYGTIKLHTTSSWYDHFQRTPIDIRDSDLSDGIEPIERFTLDVDKDGFLSDDERDEDADGLSNYDEIKSRMRPEYWTKCYGNETGYPVKYAATSPVLRDSDRDGVIDGVDDQDHDDFPNIMELSRYAASGYQYDETDDGIPASLTGGGPNCTPDKDIKADEPSHPAAYGQVNPFNPCLPDRESRTCADKLTLGESAWAPFGGPHWWALN